jgi:hypothetical protein
MNLQKIIQILIIELLNYLMNLIMRHFEGVHLLLHEKNDFGLQMINERL